MPFFPKRRCYGKYQDILSAPNLVELQLKAYEDFLQTEIPSIIRENKGLESIIREVFPIHSYDQKSSLEYLGYELGKPRYSPDECRKLKLTYGAPFKIRVRLINTENDQFKEEEVYLGEVPIMIGGGEFIINGAERVIVSQLHRSPGVDFAEESNVGEKHLHTCWIIPERGSWIDINVTKKETLVIQIDKSGKFPITIFVRALEEKYGSDEAILALFYKKEKISLKGVNAGKKILGRTLATSVSLGNQGKDQQELVLPAGTLITESLADTLAENDIIDTILVLKGASKGKKSERIDLLIVNTLAEDPTSDMNRDIAKESDGHKSALAKIFARLRPGNPFNLEKSQDVVLRQIQRPLLATVSDVSAAFASIASSSRMSIPTRWS